VTTITLSVPCLCSSTNMVDIINMTGQQLAAWNSAHKQLPHVQILYISVPIITV